MPPGSELTAPLCARAWSMNGPLLPAPLQCALLTPPPPALAVAFLLQTQSSVAKTSQGTMETRSLKTLLVKEKKKSKQKASHKPGAFSPSLTFFLTIGQ